MLHKMNYCSYLKMIVHDYHNMQHHMATLCGNTLTTPTQIGYKGAKLTIICCFHDKSKIILKWSGHKMPTA